MLGLRKFRTPTWKSAEFVDVEAATLSKTLTRAPPSVDAQRPTVPALNYTWIHISEWLTHDHRKVENIFTDINVIREVVPGICGPRCTPLWCTPYTP